jgi:hypothetical protein
MGELQHQGAPSPEKKPRLSIYSRDYRVWALHTRHISCGVPTHEAQLEFEIVVRLNWAYNDHCQDERKTPAHRAGSVRLIPNELHRITGPGCGKRILRRCALMQIDPMRPEK